MKAKKLLFYSLIILFVVTQKVNAVQLSGIYTIDSLQAPSVTNFRNFSSAIAFLSGIGSRTDTNAFNNTAPFGVSGPVIFQVAPGIYPVNSAIIVPSIVGTSFLNTVTFDGGDASTTTITGSLSSQALFRLDQCKYVGVRNISIVNNSTDGNCAFAIIGNNTDDAGTGCFIKKCSVTFGGGSGLYGIVITGASDGNGIYADHNADSIEIDSNIITGGAYGIGIRGNYDRSIIYNKGYFVRGNIIKECSAGGIYIQYLNSGIGILNNTVSLKKGTGYSCINMSDCSNDYGVVAHEIIGNNLSYGGSGIYYHGSSRPDFPVRIYNNSIAKGFRNKGIEISMTAADSGFVEVYHNTVVMENDGSDNCISVSLPGGSSGKALIKNNIFATLAKLTGGSAGGSVVYLVQFPDNSVLDHNIYYNASVNALITRVSGDYFEWNFQTPAAGGSSSYYAYPNIDLVTSLLLSGCAPKGENLTSLIPFDINGSLRSVTPDIGSEEFVAKNNDLRIVELTNPVKPVIAGLQDLTMLVQNVGSSSISSFTASYQLNSLATILQTVTYTLNPCDVHTVTFSGGDKINIDSIDHVIAYTSEPGGISDDNLVNDTIVVDYLKPLNGTYTIGVSGSTFSSFTDAGKYLLAAGVNGPVTFNINPGVYYEKLNLDTAIAGLSSSNTVTFDGGNAALCTIESPNSDTTLHTIMIGNSFVRVQNLTINTPFGSEKGWNIQLSGSNIKDIRIKNCVINTGSPNSYSDQLYGIITTISGAPNLQRVDSVEIDSNLFNNGYGCIFGSSFPSLTQPVSSAWRVTNNVFTNMFRYGIRFETFIGLKIYNNTIMSNRDDDYSYPSAIDLFNCGGLFANDPATNHNIEIVGNKIWNGRLSTGISLNQVPNRATTPGKIINNVIAGPGPSMTITSMENFLIYHNTTSASVVSTGGAGCHILNNNFIVDKDPVQFLPILPNPTIAISTMDYNNFISSDPAKNFLNLSSKYFNGANFNGANGFNINSISVDPGILNDTSLITANPCLKGTASLLIPTDINQTPRNVPSDIGAYEINPSPDDASVVSVIDPVFPVSLGLQDLSIKIKNYGQQVLTSVNVSYQLNGNSPVTQLWTGSLNTCDTGTVLFSGVNQINIATGINELKIFTSNPNGSVDGNMFNDTIIIRLGSPLNGTYIIDTIGSADFKSFTAAKEALTIRGVSGPVTFNVTAGLIFEQEPLVLSEVFGSNALSPILFQRNGIGNNPIVNGVNGVGNSDAVFAINGASHISFDGIDVNDDGSNLDNVSQMEYGYKLINNSTTQKGSCNNTIKNARINLNRSNKMSIGIVQSAIAFAGGYESGSSFEGNHHNRYENVKVVNSYNGILLTGSAQFPDSSNFITSTGADSTIIGGVNSNDIGNGSTTAYGIQLVNQKDIEVSNCIVRNVTVTTTIVHGIYLNNTSLVPLGRAIIKNNKVYNIRRTSTSTSSSGGVHGIRIDLGINSTASVINNVVFGLSSGNTSSANANIFLRGINHNQTGIGQANYFHNTVLITSGTTLNISSAAMWIGNNGGANIRNNAFLNITATQSGNARHFAIYSNVLGLFESSNNLLWSSNGNGFIGSFGSGNFIQTLSEWKRNTSQDSNSLSYLPNLLTSNYLNPDPSDTASWALNGRGRHLDSTIILTDINGISRPLTPVEGVPDIGAYEFTPTSIPPMAVAVPSIPVAGFTQSFLFGEDSVANLNWDATSTIPTSVVLRQYSGEKPPTIVNEDNYMYNYISTNIMGSLNPLFSVDLFYKDEWMGTNSSEIELRPIKKIGIDPWSLDLNTSNIDISTKKILGSLMTDTVFLLTGTNMNNPLPVRLLSFLAGAREKDVLLTWATASELNSNHFTVERSIDNKTWCILGKITANGNTNSISNYQLSDENAFIKSNTAFYRLKMVDDNGSFEYSKIVIVHKEYKKADGEIVIYPNPFSNESYASIILSDPSSIILEVIDITGRTLSIEKLELSKGVNTLLLNTSNLKNGVYFVSIQYNDSRTVSKIIKQ